MGDKMIKKKIKKITVPAIYILSLTIFTFSMYYIQKIVNNHTFKDNNDTEYVAKEIVTDNLYIPVVSQTQILIKPYLNESVTTNKTFYDINNETETQENSIIFYENTYMQNSGVSYKNNENFDVVSILDGTVIEITNNEILGNTIRIRHENDIISTYQSLSEIKVKVDDVITKGQVIGISGTCKLYDKDSNLHFELTYQGKNINPENYYNKSIDEL